MATDEELHRFYEALDREIARFERLIDELIEDAAVQTGGLTEQHGRLIRSYAAHIREVANRRPPP